MFIAYEDKCPVNVAELEKDVDLQDIITLNLTRAVQLSVDIAAHWVASLEDVAAQIADRANPMKI
jgi:hypothetical protein